jgi:phage/plasmid-associated DNA primase
LIRVSGDFYRRGPQRWAAAEEHEVKDTLIKWLATEPDAKLSRNFTGAVFDCVKAECNLLPYVTKLNVWVQFDETPKVTQRYLLATENGLLDLEPMYREQPPKLLPHDASWLCLNALPYRFDSQATCKKWLSFLAEVLGPKAKGDKRIEVLQEWFGYCLLPRAQFQNSYCCMGRELTGKA